MNFVKIGEVLINLSLVARVEKRENLVIIRGATFDAIEGMPISLGILYGAEAKAFWDYMTDVTPDISTEADSGYLEYCKKGGSLIYAEWKKKAEQLEAYHARPMVWWDNQSNVDRVMQLESEMLL